MIEQSTKGKAACDMYLPALANCLDIHIRNIQKIGCFFAVLHTHRTQTAGQKKTVNLVHDREMYSQVVYINTDDKVEIVSLQPPTSSTSTTTNRQGVEIVGYIPPDFIVILTLRRNNQMKEILHNNNLLELCHHPTQMQMELLMMNS